MRTLSPPTGPQSHAANPCCAEIAARAAFAGSRNAAKKASPPVLKYDAVMLSDRRAQYFVVLRDRRLHRRAVVQPA
jgi:hypothetical protein